MGKLSAKIINKKIRPQRVLMFGEGNFLRAFVCDAISMANENAGFDGSIVVVQPIEQGLIDTINQQDGLYTLILRSLFDGKVVNEQRVIDVISCGINPYAQYETFLGTAKNPDMRFIFSNTTEAGIEYTACAFPKNECPKSYPAKLCAWLLARYVAFKGEAPMVIIPCELIENNGVKLKEAVLCHAKDWQLEAGFFSFVDACEFCDTLVDRIVTGYPKAQAQALCDELGYEDSLLDVGEKFALFVIKASQALDDELMIQKAGFDVVYTNDITPYRNRKVYMLNGAHTTSVLLAHLQGLTTVFKMMQDADFAAFIKRALIDEILPCVDLPYDEKLSFANSVIERFSNPFMAHRLQDIALNSVSKYTVRVLPMLKAAYSSGNCKCLLASLAGLIAYYKPIAIKDGKYYASGVLGEYEIRDMAHVLEKMNTYHKNSKTTLELVNAVLSDVDLWGEDLTKIHGLKNAVAPLYDIIINDGARAVIG